MSTSTLLDVANAAFRSIGERPVLTLNTVNGDRIKDTITSACRDLEALHTWDWLYKIAPANSWSTQYATLPTYQRLFSVAVGDSTRGYRDLVYMPPFQLERLPITSYTGTTDQAQYYSMWSGTILFNKYPSDVTSQGRIRFYYQEPIIVPVLDTDTFANIPEKYIPLLGKRISSLLAIRMLDDPQASSYYQQEFEQLVQQYRDMERKAPVTKISMYRRGR